MKDLPSRDDLVATARAAYEANPEISRDLAAAVSTHAMNDLVLRLLGCLIVSNEQGATLLLASDLLTEEGWRRAIQSQGATAGKVQQVEVVLEMIVEGMKE